MRLAIKAEIVRFSCGTMESDGVKGVNGGRGCGHSQSTMEFAIEKISESFPK